MKSKVELLCMSLAKFIRLMYKGLQLQALRHYQPPYTYKTGKLQIAVVYRSPRVLLGTLITLMNGLLSHVSSCNLPCLILEDFNENILHHNSTLVNLMDNFGFAQLVKSPTSPHGTLIDHVYYKNPTLSGSGNVKSKILTMTQYIAVFLFHP